MNAPFVNFERDMPTTLPRQFYDFLVADGSVFISNRVESVGLPQLKVNHRRLGDPPDPPQMMSAPLLYCYANGIMSSRRIQTVTGHFVPVRYISRVTLPYHDTINTFRKENTAAIRNAFRLLLVIATELCMLKVGTVSINGTGIYASAGADKNMG